MPPDRRLVERRASGRCEYCRAPQHVCGYLFHVEHVVPRSGGGPDDPSNLALACASCNLAKGARTTAADPLTGDVVDLFHPRRQSWPEHFSWTAGGLTIVGRTPTGRATVVALDLNARHRRVARREWRQLGLLPG